MNDSTVFEVLPTAALRLQHVLRARAPGEFLRLSVHGGGCAGFKYVLDFDSVRRDDDVVLGDGVISDAVSLPFLKNSALEFVQDLTGDRFMVVNPKAKSSCGCGVSFSL